MYRRIFVDVSNMLLGARWKRNQWLCDIRNDKYFNNQPHIRFCNNFVERKHWLSNHKEIGRWFGFPKLNRTSIGIFKFPVNYLDVIGESVSSPTKLKTKQPWLSHLFTFINAIELECLFIKCSFIKVNNKFIIWN